MKAASDLHDLIHSLSKGEKRFISLSAEGEKAHLKLFDALEKQTVFDEEKLRQTLKDEKFLGRLAVVKHYLHDYTLKRLNAFHYNRSVESTMLQLLLEVDILFSKRLFSQVKKKLAKIKTFATENEEFEVELLCISRLRKLMSNTQFKGIKIEELHSLLKEELLLTRKIDALNRYKTFHAELFAFSIKIGEIRNESQKVKVKGFLNHPLMQNNKLVSSLNAKELYYKSRAICYNLLLDYSNSLKNIKMALEILKPRIYVHENSLRSYLILLNNTIHDYIELKDYEGAISTIEEIRNLIRKLQKNKFAPTDLFEKIMDNSYLLEMDIYFYFGQYSKVFKIINSIELIIESERIDESMTIPFYYAFAYAYFIAGKYKQVLFYLNKILNRSKNEVYHREDIYCYSRLLKILTYYESGKEVPLGLVHSSMQFLKKEKRLFKIENTFLSFAEQILLKYPDPAELNKQLKKLRSDILRYKDNPYEKKFLFYFDFISWIDSKLSKKSFIEVLEKARQ